MRIWFINHYAVPTKYYPLARPATFAKHLMQAGHDVTIFAASTVHNADLNLITDKSLYREDVVDGIHYVYVRDIDYGNNGYRRIPPAAGPRVPVFYQAGCHTVGVRNADGLYEGTEAGSNIRLQRYCRDCRSMAGKLCGLWPDP